MGRPTVARPVQRRSSWLPPFRLGACTYHEQIFPELHFRKLYEGNIIKISIIHKTEVFLSIFGLILIFQQTGDAGIRH